MKMKHEKRALPMSRSRIALKNKRKRPIKGKKTIKRTIQQAVLSPLTSDVLKPFPEELKVAAVVVAVRGGESTERLLSQLAKMPFEKVEVIPIDREKVPEPPGSISLTENEKAAIDADIVVFVTDCFPVTTGIIHDLVSAAADGVDLALCDMTPGLDEFCDWEDLFILQAFFNLCLERKELGPNGLTVFPHAMSRRAAGEIGLHHMYYPFAAWLTALNHRYRIELACTNATRALNHTSSTISYPPEWINAYREECLAAMASAMRGSGNRLTFPDTMRNRLVLRR